MIRYSGLQIECLLYTPFKYIVYSMAQKTFKSKTNKWQISKYQHRDSRYDICPLRQQKISEPSLIYSKKNSPQAYSLFIILLGIIHDHIASDILLFFTLDHPV